MIIIVIILSLIIFFIEFHYKTFYHIKGTVIIKDENYCISLLIPLNQIKYITDNHSVEIDKKNYDYQVISISNEYYSDNKTTYQKIEIEVSLDNKYKYENLTIDLKFLKENQRVIDYIISR